MSKKISKKRKDEIILDALNKFREGCLFTFMYDGINDEKVELGRQYVNTCSQVLRNLD